MTSASLLIVLVIGTAVGALTGLALGTTFGGLTTAVIAGFLGVMVGGAVRNYIVARASGKGQDIRTPMLVLIYSAIASLAASAAALEVAQRAELGTTPVFIGALAGLFAAILEGLLMITYHTQPGEAPTLRPKR